MSIASIRDFVDSGRNLRFGKHFFGIEVFCSGAFVLLAAFIFKAWLSMITFLAFCALHVVIGVLLSKKFKDRDARVECGGGTGLIFSELAIAVAIYIIWDATKVVLFKDVILAIAFWVFTMVVSILTIVWGIKKESFSSDRYRILVCVQTFFFAVLYLLLWLIDQTALGVLDLQADRFWWFGGMLLCLSFINYTAVTLLMKSYYRLKYDL